MLKLIFILTFMSILVAAMPIAPFTNGTYVRTIRYTRPPNYEPPKFEYIKPLTTWGGGYVKAPIMG